MSQMRHVHRSQSGSKSGPHPVPPLLKTGPWAACNWYRVPGTLLPADLGRGAGGEGRTEGHGAQRRPATSPGHADSQHLSDALVVCPKDIAAVHSNGAPVGEVEVAGL